MDSPSERESWFSRQGISTSCSLRSLIQSQLKKFWKNALFLLYYKYSLSYWLVTDAIA